MMYNTNDMSNAQGRHSPSKDFSISAASVAPWQQRAFDQLAPQVQAQVNSSSGSDLLPKFLQHPQVPQIPMVMRSNDMVSPFLAAPPNMVAASQQQQHQLMPMMWRPEAGPSGSFPMTMTQLHMSNLPPPPRPGESPMMAGASVAARAVAMAPLPVPVSGPAVVSVRSTTTRDSKKSSTSLSGGKRKTKASATSISVTTESSMACSEDGLDDQDSKVQQSRERNKEHARSTRLRKKAYMQKLKDMAHGLRAVQTEEIRQRRISMQKLLEIQKLRRTIVQSVLQYHASYEQDPAKWSVLLEDSFWLKQPVTPFRSFRRSEVDGDCRIIHGIEALIADAASLAVMLECVGSHTKRWKRIKRSEFVDEDFLNKEITVGRGPESSLSSASSTDSSNDGSGSGGRSRNLKPTAKSKSASYNFTPEKCHSQTATVSNSGSGKEDTKSEKKQRRTFLQQASSSSDEVAEESSSAKRQRVSVTQFQTLLSRPTSTAAHSIPSNSQLNPLKALNSYNLNLVSHKQRTTASYYMNDDDMIMIEDVMMCTYMFRTSHAVMCGALAEVIVPGMLRAHFSPNNKLLSMELIYDAMGLMQQLDSANGGDITAQVIPGSLEMALVHCAHEARVITQATPPYSILHVNEVWTNLTQRPQVEVEGEALLSILGGAEMPDNDGNIPENEAKISPLLAYAARGRPTFSTSVHSRRSGQPFVDLMCSFPLTNSNDEITHLLHVNTELPYGWT